MVRQRHLGRREALDPLQRLPAEDRGEVLLPREHVQAVVLHRRRRRDGVAPRAAEPFDAVAVGRVLRDALERVEHVVRAHLAQAVQQRAGVLQHGARLLALADQLRDELAHALVAPLEHRRVVVITDVLVVHHVLEIADDLRGAQVTAAGRDQRLVHVQRDGAGALQAPEVEAARGAVRVARAPCVLQHLLLVPADVRQPVDLLGDLAHENPPKMCGEDTRGPRQRNAERTASAGQRARIIS